MYRNMEYPYKTINECLRPSVHLCINTHLFTYNNFFVLIFLSFLDITCFHILYGTDTHFPSKYVHC